MTRFNFDNIFTTLQNGSVTNGADQSFARNDQLLSTFSASADPAGTGVERVVVKVKDHPIYGPTSDIHFFDDKNQVKLIDFGFSTCIPNDRKVRIFCGDAGNGNLLHPIRIMLDSRVRRVERHSS